jgi:hypothetical protein
VQRVTKELNKKIDLPKNTRLRLIPENVRGLVLTNSPVRGAEVDVLLQGENEQMLQQAGRDILATLDKKVNLATFSPGWRPAADGSADSPQLGTSGNLRLECEANWRGDSDSNSRFCSHAIAAGKPFG